MPSAINTFSAIGIDLGDKDAYYACLDEKGDVVEEARIALTSTGLRKTFTMPHTRFAIEAGAQSRWVSIVLSGPDLGVVGWFG